MIEFKRTITSIFIVPTLKIPPDRLLDNGFINGYIKDIQWEVDYGDCVYLLFRPKNLHKFQQFLDDEYERTPLLQEDYDILPDYIVLVYKLDTKYEKDFNLIKQGKYSKTSQEFQELFPKMKKITKDGKNTEIASLQNQIFNKSDTLKKYLEEELNIIITPNMEIWKDFNIEKESLNIEQIKAAA